MNRPFLLVAVVTLCCSGCLWAPIPQCFQHPALNPGYHPGPYHGVPLYPGDVWHGTGPCGCGDPCGGIGCGDGFGGPVIGGLDCGCHQPMTPAYGCAQPLAAGCQQPVGIGFRQPAAYPAMSVPTYADGCGETGAMQPVPDDANQRYEAPTSTVLPKVREFEGTPAPVPPETEGEVSPIQQTNLMIPSGDSVPWVPLNKTSTAPASTSAIHGLR